MCRVQFNSSTLARIPTITRVKYIGTHNEDQTQSDCLHTYSTCNIVGTGRGLEGGSTASIGGISDTQYCRRDRGPCFSGAAGVGQGGEVR